MNGSQKQIPRFRLSGRLLALYLISALFLTGCSGFFAGALRHPEDFKLSPEARELILFLQNKNLEIKTFKGTGRITILGNGKKDLTTRLAWIGSVPDRIRIAMYNIAGSSAVSFASDGRQYYLFDHTRNRFYKKRASADLFESYFSIPIKADDVIRILVGRFPEDEYRYAILDNKGTENGSVLILENRWGRILRKIYFRENQKEVSKIEVFDNSGHPAYTITFCKTQIVNGYQVPASLIFLNEDNAGFQLDIDRYWTNVAISPSVFVLTPPD